MLLVKFNIIIFYYVYNKTEQLLIWAHFIDEIFMIGEVTEEELRKIPSDLNEHIKLKKLEASHLV